MAQGERCNNIISNIFKRYLASGNKEFVRYMQYQKDNYYDVEEF